MDEEVVTKTADALINAHENQQLGKTQYLLQQRRRIGRQNCKDVIIRHKREFVVKNH